MIHGIFMDQNKILHMSEQFQCVNCGTRLQDENQFKEIPDEYDEKIEINSDNPVICNDCYNDIQKKVETYNLVNPSTPQTT